MNTGLIDKVQCLWTNRKNENEVKTDFKIHRSNNWPRYFARFDSHPTRSQCQVLVQLSHQCGSTTNLVNQLSSKDTKPEPKSRLNI